MLIYLISGKARTGKDTVASIIKKNCVEKNLRHINLQFSFYIKQYAMKITDWDGTEETKPREFLQMLGTEIIRNQIDSDLFIRRVDEDVKVYSKFFDIITISDVRLINEIEYFRKNYDSMISIHMIRDEEKTNEHSNHQTEEELNSYNKFDYVIDNNGSLEELENKVDDILKRI